MSQTWLPSRIVAGFRLVMVMIFVVSIWLDPAQPVRQPQIGFALLIGYLVWALALLVASFLDWWAEYRTARAALIVDCLLGIASVYFTEGPGQDFATPLAAQFVFLLVSATLIGGWRLCLAIGLAFNLGVVLVASGLLVNGVAIDPLRLGRRAGYLLVLTALVVWYGGRRTAPAVPRLVSIPTPSNAAPLGEALLFAKGLFGAKRGIIAWSPSEEPGTVVQSLDETGEMGWSLDPESWRKWIGRSAGPQVFAARKPAALTLDPAGFPAPLDSAEDLLPFQALGCDEGLGIPFQATAGAGLMILGALPSVSRDLLPLAASAAQELAAAFDRHALSQLSYREEFGRMREDVARDLHDSVAQSLAGASFRVEAARRTLSDGRDPDAELSALREALGSEQRHVRAIIERLRGGHSIPKRHDFADDLAKLLPEVGRQWHLQTHLDLPDSPIAVGTGQLHDLRQIAREAIANAARHGGARQVRFTLVPDERVFHLDIVDDGNGAGGGSAHPFHPRSIAERVAALGGTLDARAGPAGTRIYITVPRLGA